MWEEFEMAGVRITARWSGEDIEYCYWQGSDWSPSKIARNGSEHFRQLAAKMPPKPA